MSENKEDKNVILKDEEHLVLDHNYDGIQELDHPLPSWWVWLFYITIVFAVFYAGYYFVGPGPTLRQELDVAMKKIDSTKNVGGGSEDDETSLIAWVKDEEHASKGQQVFTSKCAACHGDKGQGIVGPNLTDDHWIHGHTLTDLSKTVREGVLDKGMPPWKELLSAEDIKNALSFIVKIHGSNPPGGKAPQGETAEWKL